MTDLFLLSQAQMRRIERYFPLPHGVARVDDRRIVSAIVFCDQERAALARRAGKVWPAQNDLQSVYSPEPPGRVHQDFGSLGAQGPQARAGDDRRHASEGASHRRAP
jgi:hypothetical protein